jgi:hypothetical protein
MKLHPRVALLKRDIDRDFHNRLFDLLRPVRRMQPGQMRIVGPEKGK